MSTGPDTVTLAVPVAHIDISDPDLGSSSPPVLTLETDVTLHGAGGAVGSGELQLLGSTVAIDHLALPQTENGGADLTISDATLDAYEGLRSWAGTTTIRRSVSSAPVRITGGSATIDASSLAGGLSNKGTGSVEVIRSTIGTAVDWGLSIDDSSTTTVTSSTITGRLRAIDPGWAASTPTTTVTLTDSTIVGGLTGAIGWRGGSATATNTVLTAPAGVAACAPAAGGQLQSGGWNLAEDGSCGLTGPNDVQSVDAGLGLLGNHGGPTPTVLALAGSPVIDAGRPTCGGTDQRGVVRPQDGDGDGTSTCDRGAVESTRYDPLTLVVDATSSEPDAVPGDGLCQTAAPVHCTLLAAIQESNESTGPDTVTLAPGATYVLALPLPANPSVDRVAVTGSLAIHGSGATIQGFGLRVVRGDLSLDELTVSVPLEADASSFTIDRSTSGGLRLENTSHATITNSTLGSAATAIDLESGTVSIDNSTISAGEGLFVRDGSASITNSTVVADSAALHLQSGSVTVGNSILGRSLAPAPDAAACLGAGSFVSQGWNLTWDASCPFTETSDRRSTDPKVGPSAPNGGPTNTRLPLTGSPAIDTGKPGCGPTDQRGLARSVDGDNDAVAGCDRGAAELAPWHPLSLTVNSTADGSDAVPGDGVCATAAPARCTIRAAVQEANASTGPDTIDLASGATYALTRSGAGEDGSATGDLDVSSSLVIHGNGSTLNGGGFDSAIQTFGGSTAIDHLSLTGVAGTDGSAGIDSRSDDLNFSDGTITSGRDGFVDRGTGSVKIYRSTVFAATRSGWNIAGSSVSVTDSTLTGTTSSDLSVGFENDSNGPVALLRSTISGRRIGIVAAGGRISVTTSTIANSTFASIDARRSTVTVVDSTLSENQYGIFRDQGTVSLTNSIISSSIGGTCFGTIGPIVSGGWNLASNANCGLTGTGDVQGVATLLGALANNGGYTLTSLPSATSPALGTGKPGCSGKDQRGTVRPSGGACDKGAVER
ncbi:MAG: choice-of-anchor Q domain-containing protein [Acidimicrobiales bacterium]